MENQLEKKDEEIERLRRIIENKAAQIENIDEILKSWALTRKRHNQCCTTN